MSKKESRTELARLEAEYPNLLELLKRTPPPPEADTDKAAGEDVLAARALSILGSAAARSRHEELDGRIVLTADQMQMLFGSLVGGVDRNARQIDRLAEDMAELRQSQMTEDSVRVISAKVVAALILGLAALVAIVGGLVKLF